MQSHNRVAQSEGEVEIKLVVDKDLERNLDNQFERENPDQGKARN
jgi:hypothetical protein